MNTPSAWQGGTPYGGVSDSPVNKCCFVHIQKRGICKYHKAFGWAKHGGAAAARLEAEQHFREKATELGAVSNQWRRVRDEVTGVDYAEVQLTKGFTTKVDLEDLPLLQGVRWRHHRGRGNTVNYAGSDKHGLMHNYLTGFKPVDHINQFANRFFVADCWREGLIELHLFQ